MAEHESQRIKYDELKIGDHVDVKKIPLDSETAEELPHRTTLYTSGKISKLPWAEGAENSGTSYAWVDPAEGPTALVPTEEYLDSHVLELREPQDGPRHAQAALLCRMAFYATGAESDAIDR